jgi:transcriptional regulator with XRE-family HTH domain
MRIPQQCVILASRVGTGVSMIGQNLRQARNALRLSLSAVATQADISVATLSRIENGKQGLEFALFLTLSRILDRSPRELIGDTSEKDELAGPIVQMIGALASAERTDLWRQLAAHAKTAQERGAHIRSVNEQVEELLAQIDFLREELTAVRSRVAAQDEARAARRVRPAARRRA